MVVPAANSKKKHSGTAQYLNAVVNGTYFE